MGGRFLGASARGAALVLGLALALAGCGGGGGGGAAGDPGGSVRPVALPVLSSQPQSLTANDGSTASFSASVSSEAPLSYQWQKNGADIAGATAASYTTPALSLTDSGAQFRLVASNSAGSVSSQPAVLTVKALAPTIDALNVSGTAALGASLSFSVRASGSQPLSYQWLRNGQAIAGATGSSYQREGLRVDDDGATIGVTVSNGVGQSVSTAPAFDLPAAGNARPVTACQDIQSSGSYVLTTDIGGAATSRVCLAVRDVQDVLIDCAGHTIRDSADHNVSALEISNVQHLALRNCRIASNWINIFDSADGSYRNNTITATNPAWNAVVNLRSSSRVLFDNNTLGGTYQQYYSSSNTISNNRITSLPGANSAAGLIVTGIATRNRIVGNTLEGQWNGQPGWNGADDGVVITDESELLVENNLITNVFDCGVEWVGTLRNSVIRGNRISKAGICGIGGWYWSSLSDTQISQNQVDSAPQLFLIMRIYGLRAAGSDQLQQVPADTEIFLRNNLFEGNRFSNRVGYWADASSYIPMSDMVANDYPASALPNERPAKAADVKISNNVFRNNDFGSAHPSPSFGSRPISAGMVVDGGGNVCKPPEVLGTYPLKCN